MPEKKKIAFLRVMSSLFFPVPGLLTWARFPTGPQGF